MKTRLFEERNIRLTIRISDYEYYQPEDIYHGCFYYKAQVSDEKGLLITVEPIMEFTAEPDVFQELQEQNKASAKNEYEVIGLMAQRAMETKNGFYVKSTFLIERLLKG